MRNTFTLPFLSKTASCFNKILFGKAVALTVAMAIGLSTVKAQTWTSITPPSGCTGFLDIDFFDANNGALALTTGGDVAWTTNGGATWSKNADIAADMYSVDMVDANTIFATGGGTTGVKTLNGGATWSNLGTGGSAHMHGGIRMATASIGWRCDLNGNIYKTTDGGASFNFATSVGAVNAFLKGYVVNANVAYWPSGTSKTIKKTADGATWNVVYTAATANILCVTGIDANNVWAGLSDGTIVKTTDGGANWTSYSTGANFQINAIDFISANEGWVVGNGGNIYYTSNGGSTWTQQSSGTTLNLSGISMVSANLGFACTNDQTLYKFTNCTAEINLQGGSPLTNIVDGDVTPSTTDGTDFGNVSVSGSLARTFTIQNTGTAALAITSITSSNALFVVSGAPTSVAAGSSATFTVTFSPTATGVQNATITVNNSDCDEGVYDFAVTGTGATPESALNFDGVDDSGATVSYPGSDYVADLTIEAWVYPGQLNGNSVVSRNYTGEFDLTFWANQLRYYHGNGTSFVDLGFNYTFSINTWYHIAVVRDIAAKSVKLYVNGNLADTQTWSAPNPVAQNVPLYLGRRPAVTPYKGIIDEVRVWNIQRTVTAIQANMNCDVPQSANLVACYRLNHGTAGGNNANVNGALDFSGNNRCMVLSNFAMTGTTSNWVTGQIPTCNPITVLLPEINLQGNGTDIADGDITPSLTDHTDFGVVTVNGSLARTYTIQNTGVDVLTISSITSSNVKFVVSGAPTTVAVGSSATFTVTFSPTATGMQNATITVNNSDCDEGVYDFAVTGTGADQGASLNFDGVNDYIITASNTSLDLSVQTVELWAKPTGGGDNDLLVGKRNYNASSFNDTRWSIHFQNGNQGLYFYSPAGWANWTYSFTPNQWYHIAMVTDATSTKLYIDGTFISSKPTTINSPTNLPLIFGASAPNFEVFPGNFDEVRIWNTARTCDEINQLRNCELTGSEANLLAYYKFNQGFASENNSGVTTLTDATSGNNNGTLLNFGLTSASSNWVTPGGVTTGTSCPAVTAAEINLQGGSPLVSIIDGDVTPSTTDGTDFGNVAVSGSLAHTFTIQNTGTSVLTITSITSSSALFVVSGAPTTVAAGSSATFTVTFSPTATGVQNATITVNNSDCDEGVYDFAVTGTGATPASALHFDGVNDYVEVPHNAALNITGNVTLEAWVKTSSSTEQYIISKANSAYLLAVNPANAFPGKAAFFLHGPSSGWLNSNTRIDDGNWHHVAGVRNGTTAQIFIDGVLDATAAVGSGSITTSTVPLTIGWRSTYPTTVVLNGSADEVRIWNVARTCDQINQLRNCELTGSESGLVAYYKFNQGFANENNSGVTTLTDATSNNINGTLIGFALTGTSSNWVNPGGVTTGTSCPTTITAPEVNIQGGSPLTDIVDGDVTPSTTDGTDFGNVLVNGSFAKSYTIQNTGTGTLTITSITSSNALFVVSGAPTSVAAGSSATFTVTFSPTATGVQNATITVNNSDCDEGVYDFAVTGTGATPGAALQFDGTNDYVSLNGTFGGPTWTEATIEAWVKVDATSADLQAIVSPSDLSFVHFQMFSAGSNVAFTNNNNVLLPMIPQTPTGQWRHLAMVIKSGDSKVYVDGVQQGATVTTTFGNILASNGVFIGRGASGSRYLNGNVDEVRIWNRALCQSEILAQKDCELTGSESGLAAYYKFNQGIAGGLNSGLTTLTDAAGGDNNGTLTNFALTGATSNWVTPGGVTTGTSCPATITAPEINLQGGSPLVSIVDGDVTPSTTDGTDFGGISGTSLTRTFTIQNTGTSNLSVSTITVAGTNAGEFVVGGITLPATVTPSTSTTFTVTFTPTANGTRVATVTVNNNDCDEAVYDFAVSGGRQGTALAFDGTDDRVPVANQPLANINQFTLEAYVNIRSNASYSTIYAEGLTSSLGPMFSISVLANGSLELVLRNASSVGLAVNTAAGLIPVGQWKHVAFVRTSATTALLYIDGVQQGSYTFTDPGAISVNVTNIGVRQRSTFDGYLIGSLDEVCLWSTARSCEEISQLQNCELAGNESGLIAYYKFNQGVADGTNTGITTLTNAVSGGLNGTLTNFSLSGTTSNWTSPGGVTTGTSCPAVTAAEINVQGGSPLVSIVDGDVTPSTTDGTDFGNVAVSGSLARTFTIQNTGTAVLTITSITSSNALFVVSGAPASVAAGSSATFTVTFSPTATGVQNATITVNNSDCDESVYDFAVTGNGANPGAALSFDGANDYVDCGNATGFNPNNIKTMETWVKFNSLTNDQDIMTKATTCTGTEMLLFGSNLAVYFMKDCSNFSRIEYPKSNLTAGQWFHIAVTWDGTKESIKLYVNGISVGTLIHTGNINATGLGNPANGFYLGQWGPLGRPLNGYMDDARVWSTTRTCDEINQLRNCELTSSETGLLAYYQFNQGFAASNNNTPLVNTLTDVTANGNNGTLINFALTGATSNWVTPGGVTTGTSCSAVTAAEINTQGGSPLVTIVDGDVTPSTTDDTDFGTVVSSLARSFTIQNTGTSTLTISSITSSNVKFVVSGAPASVAAGSSATFTVTFSPTGSGAQTATITINNNDCNEGVYDFAVSGTGCVAPSFTVCPASTVTANTSAGQCSAAVSYTVTATGTPSPTLTYTFTGATTGSGSGTGSGSTFNKGNTTVTVTATNGCGSNAVCSFTVTVNDNIVPTISGCPANQSLTNASGVCTQTYSIPFPTLADNCAGPLTWNAIFSANPIANPANLSGIANNTNSTAVTFNKGATTVTLSARDASNNNSTVNCSFTVTVTDNEPPVVTCAPDVTVNNTTGLCTGTATLTPPAFVDNCSAAPGNALDFDGSNDYISLPYNLAGVTTFTYETWVNVRANQAWARILDFGHAAGLNIFFTTSANGSGQPRFAINLGGGEQLLTGPSVLPLNTWTHLAVTLNGSTAIMYVNGVNVAQNNAFTYTPASLAATTNNWIGRSQYADPYFNGQLDEIRFWNVVRTQAQIQAAMNTELTGSETGLLHYYRLNQGIAGGNNSGVTSAIDTKGSGGNGTLNLFALTGATSNWVSGQNVGSTLTNNAPSTYPKGPTTVTWTGTDAAGNSSACQQIVTVVDNQVPALTAPANQTFNVIANTCAANYTIADPIADNCTTPTWGYILSGATTATVTGIADGTSSGVVSFNTGVTTVTLTGVDASGNLAVQKTFTVTVNDNQAPTITCPANIAVNNDVDQCSAVASFTNPVGSDNCPSVVTIQTTGLASGAAYPVGTTTNTFQVTAANGQTATCAFTVTVTDNQAPVISCPANIAVNNDAGQCGAVVTYTVPMGTDNCSGVTTALTTGLASGATFPVGTTTNTFQVTAANGQAAGCAFVVTVTDAEVPTITCPANIAVNNDAGQCGAVVTYNVPTGTDNCSGATTAQTAGLASGAVYSVGSTTNTFVVTAANLQTANCSFTVTVTDAELPTITCPSNTVSAPVQGLCSAVVTGIDAVYNDNCVVATLGYTSSGATVLSGSGQASGQSFSPGLTTVTYTVTDGVSLVNTCSFTVTMSPCVQISGNIKWENNNAPVKDADVRVEILPGATLLNSILTNTAGNFTVTPGTAGDYRIRPVKNINLLNGVTVADATRIQQHITNNPPLVGAYKRIAADVNKSNSITTYDANLIAQAIAGSPSALLTFNTSWRFVPTSYTFPNPNVPWGFPEKIDFTGLTTSQTNVNFVGVKIGDVNGSSNPQLKPAPPVVWQVEDAALEAGQPVTVRFAVDHFEDIAAYQFALGFDPAILRYNDMSTSDAIPMNAENIGAFEAETGELRLVWFTDRGRSVKSGTTVFTLHFTAQSSGVQLSDVLQLNDKALQGIAYNTALEERGVALVYRDAQTSGIIDPNQPAGLELLQNVPNPTAGRTTIGFVLPQSCEAQLRILDVNGRLVTEKTAVYPAGYQQETFDLSGQSGVLYYELTTPFGTLVKKMIVVLD